MNVWSFSIEYTIAGSIDMWKLQTKEEEIQAFVGHVFIDQYRLILLNAAAQNFHKIHVLQLDYKHDFIF